MRLYNTLSRKKELFETHKPGHVGIYLCGPTVYMNSHIGHAVGPVIFDAFKKYLTYKGYQVKLIVNITDVDDKIIQKSQQLGISMEELAKQVTENYFEALGKLGVDSIDIFPRATEHIPQIIDVIQRLAENGAAYEMGGDVYFDISCCKDYGKLSHRKMEDQISGKRELASTNDKRNPGDFALWKKAGDDEPGWDSPWGRGRPGWHIECTAMSMHYLGESYDIHGGGIDLIFPHHENEIAQAETATGKPYVRYWMHNGLTRVKTKANSGDWKNEKMSKSLGNIKSLTDLMEHYPGYALRFFLLSTHYRRPIDFSDQALEATQKGMMSIYHVLGRAEQLCKKDVYVGKADAKVMREIAQDDADRELTEAVVPSQLRFLEMLDDDFNTAGAIAVLFELCSAINRYIEQKRVMLQNSEISCQLLYHAARMVTFLGQIVGLFEEAPETGKTNDALTGKLVELFIEMRNRARKDKNFALADEIRDKLKGLGVVLEDGPDGTVWRND